MAAKKIKGITIEIGGDTTKLDQALKSSEDQSKDLQQELKAVNAALKFNPDNVELIAQKQKILKEQIQAVTDKLKTLKSAEAQVQKQFEAGEIGEDQYRAFRREVIQTESRLKNLNGQLTDTGSAAKKAKEGFTVLKGVLADLAATAIKSALSGLKNLAKNVVTVGSSFETAMSNNAALFKATGSDLEALTETAKTYGETTQFSASEAAAALGYMGQAGWDARKSCKELGGVLSLAASTGMDLAKASSLTTDNLAAFSKSAMSAAGFADMLAYAQANSNTSAEELGEAYQNSAANLNAAGQDARTVTAILATLANAGVKGSRAGTQLSAMMRDLTAKMKDGKIQIGDTSVAVQDADGNYRNLLDILGDVQKATQKMGDAERSAALKSVFTSESISGLNIVLDAGVESTKAFEKRLMEVDGTASAMAETMNDNVAGAIKMLKSNIEGKMIKVFDSAKGSIKTSIESISSSLDALDWDAIAEGVGAFSTGIAGLFKFLTENADGVLAALAGIGAAMAVTFAVKKISDFVSALGKVKTAVSTLWTIMSAHPIGIVAGAVAGLATAFVALRQAQDKAIEAEYGLTEQQKKSVKASQDLKKAYDDLKASRDEAVGNVTAEYDYIRDLQTEYNGLIDASGKIKKGYEDRANFILEKLSQALGLERDEILKNAEANGTLGESINQIILKKQAEATLLANESAYTEAIRQRNTALSTYLEAQDTYQAAEKKLGDLVDKNGDVLGRYNEMLSSSPATADDFYWANQTVIKAQQAAKKALKDAEGALTDAETAYVGYNTTISNYEGLSASVVSGDAKKINESLIKLQADFVTAETGTKKTLTQQVANLRAQYDSMAKAIKNGTPGVTREQLAAAKSMVDAAERELAKLPAKASTAGGASGKNYALAIASDSNQKASQSAGLTLATSAKGGAESVDSSSSGGFFAQGFVNGIQNFIRAGVAAAAAKGLVEQAHNAMKAAQQEGSPSKLTRQSGEYFSAGYVLGIEDKTKDAVKAAKNMVQQTTAALKGDYALVMDPPQFNPVAFGRQFYPTSEKSGNAPDLSAVIGRLDNLENAIRGMRFAVMLDGNTLVGETINRIDAGLAGVYQLKARGI